MRFIYINTKNPIKTLELYNSLGKKILEEKNNNFNSSKLNSGTYIVKINLMNGNILENKIVIE